MSCSLLQYVSATSTAFNNDDDDTTTAMLVLSMALWTNQGHIHSHFLDTSATMSCFEQLLEQSSSLELLGDEDEDRLFFLDAMVNFSPHPKVAPAA